VTTDVDVVDIQTQLWKIYSAFANIVVQNPNWSVEDEIDMPEFTAAVDTILSK
jgi:singapore isolate B (sub-type 7) whole genome shotgun sequence assembly, scaffold_5